MKVPIGAFLIFTVIALSVLLAHADEGIYKNCSDSVRCAEDKLKELVDRIDSEPKIEFFDGSVVLEKKTEAKGEQDAVKGRSDEDVLDRLARFMKERQLKIAIPDEDGRSGDIEARKRGKKLRRFILPLLLVLKLKAAIIIPALLSLIALVSFKGLGASIMALTIAFATGLKSLLESHAPKVSYEVVPQIHAPLWNRAGIEAYPLGQGYHTI